MYTGYGEENSRQSALLIIFSSQRHVKGLPLQCQTNVLSRSKAFVFRLLFQKRWNIFVFETKFWIETKRFLSVLENFGSKAFVMVSFQIFWRQLKVLFWL
jgi:hypothetical protein